MDRSERAELAVLCLIRDGDKVLLQNRVKKDWPGYTLPGGHVECGESFVDAVIREMKEETGLTIMKPKMVGIKQFPMKNGRYEEGRYIVLLFVAEQFTGEVVSSEEGEMEWVKRSNVSKISAVDDLEELLQVFENPDITEFQYLVDGDNWEAVLK